MKKLLSLAALSVLIFSACSHDSSPATAPAGRKPDREYNSLNGNFERQPPFGPRSNKTLDQ